MRTRGEGEGLIEQKENVRLGWALPNTRCLRYPHLNHWIFHSSLFTLHLNYWILHSSFFTLHLNHWIFHFSLFTFHFSLPLRFAPPPHNHLHLSCGQPFNVLLVSLFHECVVQLGATFNPHHQSVYGHVWVGRGEVEEGKLLLGVWLDIEIHKQLKFRR